VRGNIPVPVFATGEIETKYAGYCTGVHNMLEMTGFPSVIPVYSGLESVEAVLLAS